MAFAATMDEQEGPRERSSLGQPATSRSTLDVGHSLGARGASRATGDTPNTGSPGLHTNENNAPRISSEREFHVIDDEESSIVQECNHEEASIIPDETQMLDVDVENGDSATNQSFRESDGSFETCDDDKASLASSVAETFEAVVPSENGHSNRTTMDSPNEASQGNDASNPQVVLPTTVPHSINASDLHVPRPSTPNNPTTYAERMRQKELDRTFSPAVRVDRRPSTPDLHVDMDEEKEEIRERIGLSKHGDHELPSAIGRGPSVDKGHHTPRSEEVPSSGMMELTARSPTHVTQQPRHDEEDALVQPEQEDDPVPELPSVFEGDNQRRPGAFTAPGRAFGDYPVWGRTRPPANYHRNSDSSGTTAASSTLRRGSDGMGLRGSALFTSFRVATHWLPTGHQQPQQSEQQGDNMVEAQAVDAETLVYASDVKVDVSRRIIRTYTFAVAFSCLVIIVLAVSLSLALTRDKDNRHPMHGTGGNASTMSDACKHVPDAQKDVFALCRCYNTAEKLVNDWSAEERNLYVNLHSKFSELELFSESVNDTTSCTPENQSLLWIANYMRLGLTFSDLENYDSISNYEQIFALACLYLTLNGDGWKQNDGWLKNISVCSWYGISCGIITRIMSIKLNSNGLVGTIPSAIRLFPFLQMLDLSGNRGITGTIPNGVGNMSLYQLDLSGCGLTGTIPSRVQEYNRIEEMHFDGNDLTGCLPYELGDLTALRTLSVRGNHLNGTIPESFGKLTSLAYLDLSHNLFTGTVPSFLSNLTFLDSIFLQDNRLTGSFPDSFCNASFKQLDDGCNPKLVLANCNGNYSLTYSDDCSCCKGSNCKKVLFCVEEIPEGFQGTF